jgi:hypothetical protein
MKISGFSMARNADKLYYPLKEAILSVLPIVDEFVVAIGKGDPDDHTLEIIRGINDPKVKIIETVWDLEKYPRGMENAHQTDIARSHCTGDWLLYLQADEVIHERYLPEIVTKCERYVNDREVEGMVFRYRHFWGDYGHYQKSHHWYSREIRIVRNEPDIHSWESAQSFRRIPAFDGLDYRQQENTFKLKVIALDAYIYHYGWVRPPQLMVSKTKSLDTIHKGASEVERLERENYFAFDYGPLNLLAEFTETHPAVMAGWIARFNWKEQLQFSGKPGKNRRPHVHEQFRYRLMGWIKRNIPGAETLGEFRNYILLKR